MYFMMLFFTILVHDAQKLNIVGFSIMTFSTLYCIIVPERRFNYMYLMTTLFALLKISLFAMLMIALFNKQNGHAVECIMLRTPISLPLCGHF